MHGLKHSFFCFHAVATQMKHAAHSCRKRRKGEAGFFFLLTFESKPFQLLFLCLIIQFTLGHGELISLCNAGQYRHAISISGRDSCRLGCSGCTVDLPGRVSAP